MRPGFLGPLTCRRHDRAPGLSGVGLATAIVWWNMPSTNVFPTVNQLEDEVKPSQPVGLKPQPLVFGTFDTADRPEDSPVPLRTRGSSRKSNIPRAPLPGSPREVDRTELPLGGGSCSRSAVVSPGGHSLVSDKAGSVANSGSCIPARSSLYSSVPHPRTQPRWHSASLPLPAAKKAEHQRNLSAPSAPQGRQSRQGSVSSTGGKEICRYFLRTGTCGYGNKCRYDHPKTAHKPNLNSHGYPLREGECICRFFVKNGWCGFGATCKFHHPELPQRPAQAPILPPAPYPANVYPPPAQMYPVAHHGMYPGTVPASTVMPPVVPIPPGMYNPYAYMKGMPPMMPPVSWMLAPPSMPMGGSPCGQGGSISGRDVCTESDVSASSMLPDEHRGSTELVRQDSYSHSEPPCGYH